MSTQVLDLEQQLQQFRKPKPKKRRGEAPGVVPGPSRAKVAPEERPGAPAVDLEQQLQQLRGRPSAPLRVERQFAEAEARPRPQKPAPGLITKEGETVLQRQIRTAYSDTGPGAGAAAWRALAVLGIPQAVVEQTITGGKPFEETEWFKSAATRLTKIVPADYAYANFTRRRAGLPPLKGVPTQEERHGKAVGTLAFLLRVATDPLVLPLGRLARALKGAGAVRAAEKVAAAAPPRVEVPRPVEVPAPTRVARVAAEAPVVPSAKPGVEVPAVTSLENQLRQMRGQPPVVEVPPGTTFISEPPRPPAAAVEPRLAAVGPEFESITEVGKRISSKPTVNAVDIVNYISEAFRPVRVGRFPPGLPPFRGIFKPGPEVIRVKDPFDLDTVTHEWGHLMDRWSGNALRGAPEVAELEPVFGAGIRAAGYSPGAVARELVANFAAVWMRDAEAARKVFPAFTRVFEGVIQRDKLLAETVRQAQKGVAGWFAQTPEAKILSTIAPERVPKQAWMSRWDRISTDWKDELRPLWKLEDALFGRTVKGGAYEVADIARGGRAAARAQTWMEYRQLDAANRELGPSLNAILSPIGHKRDLFEAYWLAKHAKEVTTDIPTSIGRNAEEVLARAGARGDAELFDNAIEQIQKYRWNLIRETLVDSGFFTQAEVQTWFKKYASYAPLRRVFSGLSGGPSGATRGFVDLGRPIKGRKGSRVWPIRSPINELARDTALFHTLSEQNRVGAKLLEYATSAEAQAPGRFLDVVPVPKQAVTIKLKEISDTLEDIFQTDLTDEVLERTATIFRKGWGVPKENVVIVWRNGKMNALQVMNDDLYRSLKWLDGASWGVLEKLIHFPAKVTSTFRAGIIFNPDFWLRNVSRDTFQSVIQSEWGINPLDIFKSLYHTFGKTDEYYKAVNSGALQGTLQGLDQRSIRRTMETILAGGNPGGFTGRVSFLMHPVDTASAIAQATEAAPKMAEFLAATRKLGRAPTRDELLRIGLDARAVNVNFSRQGAQGKRVGRLAAFWQAGMEGNARTIRAFQQNPKRFARRAFTWVTLPTLAFYLKNRNDPVYQAAPAWLKATAWYVGGKYFWIPKPFLVGTVFSTIPEFILAEIDRMDAKSVGDVAQAFFSGLFEGGKQVATEFTESFVPEFQAVMPFMELIFNADYFRTVRGGFRRYPIVPESELDLPGREQFGPYTPETAKLASRVIGALTGRTFEPSPRKIEKAVRGFTGGVGQAALKAPETVGEVLRGERIAPYDVPGLRGFARPPYVSNPDVEDFYREMRRLRGLVQLRNRGRPGGISKVSSRMTHAEKQLRELRSLRNQIAVSKLPEELKRRRVEALDLRIINAARSALRRRPIVRR